MLTRRRAWGLTLMATLTMTVSYLDRQALAVLAPTVTQVFGLSERAYGLLASAFSMAYLVGTPAAGWLLDRVGARRGLLGSLLVWTAVAAAHALAPSYSALFALRILLGLAEAPSFPGAAQTVQRSLPPDERSRGMGVLFTGSSVGAMIAPLLATRLQGSFGWQGAFLGSALVGLVWVPLWLLLTSSDEVRRVLDAGAHDAAPPEQGDSPLRPVGAGAEGMAAASARELLTHPGVLRAVAMVLTSAPAISFTLLWASKYLVKVHAVAQLDVGRYLWLPPLLYDLGSILFGDLATRRRRRVADPLSPARALVAVASCLAAMLALAPFGGSLAGSLFFISVSMAGGGGLYALSTADMLSRVPPGSVSTVSGIAAATQSLIYIILHPTLGYFLDHGGTYDAIQIALGLWVLPGAAVWLLWSPLPRSRAPAASV